MDDIALTHGRLVSSHFQREHTYSFKLAKKISTGFKMCMTLKICSADILLNIDLNKFDILMYQNL